MACIWNRDEAEGWTPTALCGSVALIENRVQPVLVADPSGSIVIEDPRAHVLLMRQQGTAAEGWALVARRDARLRVNGRVLATGLCALKDRDAIQVGGGSYLFLTTERPAQIEVIEDAASGTTCPRCKQAIGTPTYPVSAVRCPGCGVAHHQSEELPCWTGYEGEPFATCALCDHPGGLGGGFRWSPEDL